MWIFEVNEMKMVFSVQETILFLASLKFFDDWLFLCVKLSWASPGIQ